MDNSYPRTCRGAWACVTIDQFRHSSLRTFRSIGRPLIHAPTESQGAETYMNIMTRGAWGGAGGDRRRERRLRHGAEQRRHVQRRRQLRHLRPRRGRLPRPCPQGPQTDVRRTAWYIQPYLTLGRAHQCELAAPGFTADDAAVCRAGFEGYAAACDGAAKTGAAHSFSLTPFACIRRTAAGAARGRG